MRLTLQLSRIVLLVIIPFLLLFLVTFPAQYHSPQMLEAISAYHDDPIDLNNINRHRIDNFIESDLRQARIYQIGISALLVSSVVAFICAGKRLRRKVA